ncbi:MAG: hypothetical protein J6C52_07595 [Clostridia bacterium]|nr:hypothetical protein [Clostridia bacterium]
MSISKRYSALLLAMLLLASSCGGEAAGTDTTASDTADTTAANTEEAYDFSGHDFGGKKFVFLSNPNDPSVYNYIDVESLNGDIINDAIWERNSFIEDTYNVDIIHDAQSYDQLGNLIRSTVMAGDDAYQAAYLYMGSTSTFMEEGLLHDLTDGSGFHFDEVWWDRAIIKDLYIGDDKALYLTSSDLNLINFEYSWCMYFNKRMLDDLQMEAPYQLVLDGKWTFDELYKYISAGANLNGAESWAFAVDSPAVYGFTSMSSFILQAFLACDMKPLSIENGQPQNNTDDPRFHDVAEKLAKIIGEEGTSYICANSRNTGNHYEEIYKKGGAFFTACEIKGGDGGGAYSEMTDYYGIVPLPKFDAEQKNYVSPVAIGNFMMCVPKSNNDLEMASVILDAMSYVSWRDIVPQYYETVIQTKHIRDEETKEMLDIIREARTYYSARAFGWGEALRTELQSSIKAGNINSASLAASHKESIAEQFKSSMEKINAN